MSAPGQQIIVIVTISYCETSRQNTKVYGINGNVSVLIIQIFVHL